MVHKERNRLRYVPWKARRVVAAERCAIYGTATLPDAEQACERFAERWDTTSPVISPRWLGNWDRLTVLFDHPPAIRRALYTPNTIESLQASLRKVRKNRGALPHDESIVTRWYLALQHVVAKWTQPMCEWQAVLNQCVILYGARVPV
jgi:transposase-like protein